MFCGAESACSGWLVERQRSARGWKKAAAAKVARRLAGLRMWSSAAKVVEAGERIRLLWCLALGDGVDAKGRLSA